MQATKSRSGLTMRPKRKISRLAATISPAMSPTRAEPRRAPMSAVSTATPTAASAEHEPRRGLGGPEPGEGARHEPVEQRGLSK